MKLRNGAPRPSPARRDDAVAGLPPSRSGIVGLVAVLATVAGTWLWLELVMDPIRLATGLAGARDHITAARAGLSKGQLKRARLETLEGQAAARRARAGLENDPMLDLAAAAPAIDRVLDDVDLLVSAAGHTASAARASLDVADSALRGPDKILATSSPEEKGAAIRIARVEDMGALLSDARTSVASARRDLERVDEEDLPARFRGAITRGIADARKGEKLLGDAAAGLALLPTILGGDDVRTYVIGMQNYAELRGSGGALLQFAVLEMDGGDVRLVPPESVYKIDKNRRRVAIDLPKSAWYVRGISDAQRFGNANWSPDWPLSARLTLEYARARTRDFPQVDGFIAMDPTVLEKLVPGIGAYRTKWGNYIARRTAVNFLVYLAYGKFPRWFQRRVALKQVVDGFFERMFKPDHPSLLVEGMGNALVNKHMQIWMADPAEQRFVEEMEWDGALDKARGADYLNVVQQNVGGNKLDFYAHQETTMDVDLRGPSADVSTTVAIRNGVFLPQADWAMGNSGPLHRPMVNVYVPETARLQRAAVRPSSCPRCARYVVGSEEAGSGPAPPLARIDTPEPAAWTGGSPAEHIELGKRVWSATLQIPPNETGSITYDYGVPRVVRDTGVRNEYRVVVQHQPKVRPDDFTLRIDLPDDATTIVAPGFERKGGALVWEGPLETDMELEVSWRG